MVNEPISRLAVMIVALPGVPAKQLRDELSTKRAALAGLFAKPIGLRIGVRCDPDPLAASMGERKLALVDAAIEFTGTAGDLDDLFRQASKIVALLDGLIDRRQTAMMGGTTYPLWDEAGAGVFLSLAIGRYPGLSVQDFRHWWLHRHGPLAGPLLRPLLLEYAQVHVEHERSAAAAAAAGVQYPDFDGYDNLGWASVDAFVESTCKPEVQQALFNDEEGHLNPTANWGAVMEFI
jgi:hypothetical protein